MSTPTPFQNNMSEGEGNVAGWGAGASQHQGYQQVPQYPYPVPEGEGAYYAQAESDPLTNITLNYWLSVFFSVIPALVFYFVARGKVDPFTFSYYRANLNFSILRTTVSFAAYVVGAIPFVGWVFSFLVLAGSMALFALQVLAAAKAPMAYRQGERPPFVFNIDFVK